METNECGLYSSKNKNNNGTILFCAQHVVFFFKVWNPTEEQNLKT